MPVADARLPDATLQGRVVRGAGSPQPAGGEAQTIPRRGNFVRGSICVKDLACERYQHAAMPPMFDQIKGAITDQLKAPNPNFACTERWKCGASNLTSRDTSVAIGSEHQG